MSRNLRLILFFSDFVSLNFSLFIAIRLIEPDLVENLDSRVIYLFGFSNLSLSFLLLVSNPNDVSKGSGIARILKGQLAFIFIHLLLTLSLVFFFEQLYSFVLLVLVYGIFFSLYFLFRLLVFYIRNVITVELPQKNFVLIGRNQLAEEVRKYYLLNPEEGYSFLGYVDGNSLSDIFERLNHVNNQSEIHEIFCCIAEISKDELNQLMQFGLNSLIKVKLLVQPAHFDTALRWDKLDRFPGIDRPAVALDDRGNRLLKRCFDILFSAMICTIVMSWLTPIVALLIKISSPGPVFFLQLRSGENNKPFWCLKFRTMSVNAESDSRQASSNDDRVTRLGRFLRRSSIDELPQFFNVFAGTMSVVGPRPHMLRHTEEYSQLIDKFISRQYVKPGITGLAQCLGYRGETKNLVDMENRVRLDRYYIENWSFWLDIRIIFLTIISLIRGSDKAY